MRTIGLALAAGPDDEAESDVLLPDLATSGLLSLVFFVGLPDKPTWSFAKRMGFEFLKKVSGRAPVDPEGGGTECLPERLARLGDLFNDCTRSVCADAWL